MEKGRGGRGLTFFDVETMEVYCAWWGVFIILYHTPINSHNPSTPISFPTSSTPPPYLTLTPINPLLSLIIHPLLLPHQPLPPLTQFMCPFPIPILIRLLGLGETVVGLGGEELGTGAEGLIVGVGGVDLVLVLEGYGAMR